MFAWMQDGGDANDLLEGIVEEAHGGDGQFAQERDKLPPEEPRLVAPEEKPIADEERPQTKRPLSSCAPFVVI